MFPTGPQTKTCAREHSDSAKKMGDVLAPDVKAWLCMKFLYGSTIALSAVLLFSVEPMMARALLPALGGSSAVWISALAFFQVVLLAGYGYATLMTTTEQQRPGLALGHLVLLAAAACSLVLVGAPGVRYAGVHSPQLRLFALLGATVGLPFMTLSTTAPLLQTWYARRERKAIPYRLFALSNLASLAALLGYPTLLEPYLPLRAQFALWKGGFAVYLVLVAVLTVRMRSAMEPAEIAHPEKMQNDGEHERAPVARRKYVFWLALPAVASMQLAAVTAHLTQDVASMPLLWVVPLAAYLLSFVLAFEFPRLYRQALAVKLLAVLLFSLGYFLAQTGMNVPIGISIVLYTAELLVACWVCHAEVYALRPQETTASARFYLMLAAGGALGTLAVAVVSPLVTDSNFDLPASFVLTAAVVMAVVWDEGWPQRALWGAGTACGVYLLVLLHGAYDHDALFRARNFYGSLRVRETRTPPQAMLSRTLYNGNIQHGMEWFSDEFHHVPLTYYAPDSGVGRALESCCGAARPRRIGVIGLGAGTLAAYGRAGDQIRFYEINPLVTGVAQTLFTYTRDTPATVTVVPGDARLSLAAEAPNRFDVLVIDAFSGDSIPVHLLTREALALYRRHLAPGGVLAFHISNQYLDLQPVVARLAESDGLAGREVESGPDESRGDSFAAWVLLTDRAGYFDQQLFAGARPIRTVPAVRLWTDDYSSLLPIVRWGGRKLLGP